MNEKSGLLKLHHLRPAPGAKRSRMRVGRGSASKGKTAGRGTKGTLARGSVRPGFEGGQMPLHMRLPKLRGFKNPFRVSYQVISLARLVELYPRGGTVTTSDLVKRGAARPNSPLKVLSDGDLGVRFDLTVDRASRTAVAKIEAAGGSVTERLCSKA